ncbi:MAG: PKD domain-containing protein, partial [Bacteroidota bacterium]
MNLLNSTSGSHAFLWDFCTEDFESIQTDTSIQLTPGVFGTTAGAALIADNSGLYGFICNRDGSLIRVDYSNGAGQPFSNLVSLGNASGAATDPNDISFIQENGIWYAFVVNVFSGSVGKIEFANGLGQPPTTSQVVINSGLGLPRGVKCVKDVNGEYHIFIANFTANTISHFSFGTSLSNQPVLLNTYNVPGSANIIDVDLILDCDNWFMAVCSYGSNDLVIASMGANLSSVNPVYNTPFANSTTGYSVRLVRNGFDFYSMTTNSGGILTVQHLGTNLSSLSPTLTGTFSFGAAATDMALFYQDSRWYGLTPYENGSGLVHTLFEETCLAVPASSTDSIPTGVFFLSSDTFNISLTASGSSGQISSIKQPVFINESPQAGFNWIGNCLGSSTQFSNTSSIGSGTLTSYSWTFGDGGVSSSQSPAYTYSAIGSFQVTMNVTAGNGCSSEYDTAITISPVPIASFTIGNSCSETVIPLNNSSTISSGSVSGWLWDFGNGDTSTATIPQYAYPGGGNFQITLIATSDAGCSDTILNGVVIQDRPIGSLDVSNTCVGQSVQFNDLSTIVNSTIISRSWYFGDGDSSNIQNPVHSYAGGPSNYPLELVVTAANGCIDTVDYDLRVSEQPVASFTFLPGTICSGMEISFDDLSSVSGDTISAWSWSFGDGATDTISDPQHTFQQAGSYSVSLVAYSPSRCASTLTAQTINVLQGPTPYFTAQDACVGTPVYFIDQSIPAPGSTIISYFWTLGDGSTSIAQNPFVPYAASGSYEVTQNITTDQGCVASNTQTVYVRGLPEASFSFDLPCNGVPVSFTNTSTTDSSSVLLFYSWDFGDPASGSTNTSALPNPTHVFTGQSAFDVRLVVENNFGCEDTVTNTLNILPASNALFTYSPTCY